MDITTVENKVKDFIYNNDEEFNEDIRLIWRNAKQFNSPRTDIYQIAERLEAETEQLILMTTDRLFQKKEPNKSSSIGRKKETLSKELSVQEQAELSEQIKLLVGQDLVGVWNIVQNHLGAMCDDKKEFQVKLLPVNVQKELQKYVKNKIKLMESRTRAPAREPKTTLTMDNRFSQN